MQMDQALRAFTACDIVEASSVRGVPEPPRTITTYGADAEVRTELRRLLHYLQVQHNRARVVLV